MPKPRGLSGDKLKVRKNAKDLFYAPVNYDIKQEVPLRELVEVAAYIHMDLEEAGFSTEEVQRIGTILTKLARTVTGGTN